MTADAMRETRRPAYETTRPDVQRMVPTAARRILDFGCASGQLGAALKTRQEAEVVGIEIVPAYARDAAVVLDRVICADATEALATKDLGTFDCVIAADVLEHLVDPWTTLSLAVERLNPGGTVVVSLPNVQYLRTFRELVRGRWPREDTGPYDRTHLQWFTVRDGEDLLHGAGLEVVDRSWSYFFSGDARRVARALGPRAAPYLAGQFVLAGRRAS